MTETMELLCVCDEEMCFCTNKVIATIDVDQQIPGAVMRAPEIACDQCKAGDHRWAP